MYIPKRRIPDEELRKFKLVYDPPEELAGLTDTLLADLYDLTIKFGTIVGQHVGVQQLYVRERWHILIKAASDPRNPRLEIVGPGGPTADKSHRLYYLHSQWYCDWDKRLAIGDVIDLISFVDGLMLTEGYVDLETGERRQTDHRNDFTPPHFWVDRYFSDARPIVILRPESTPGDAAEVIARIFDQPEQVEYAEFLPGLPYAAYHKRYEILMKDVCHHIRAFLDGQGAESFDDLQKIGPEEFLNRVRQYISNLRQAE